MENTKLHYLVATAIVIKDGKYLIAKRAEHEKVNPGEWTVPGGKLELNDYAQREKDTKDAWYNVVETLLRREVKEEADLEIKNIQYLTSLAFVRPDNIPVVVMSFYADWAGREVQLSPDLTEYAWVTLEEAKNYSLIEGIYEELVMLDEVLKKGSTQEWVKKSS